MGLRLGLELGVGFRLGFWFLRGWLSRNLARILEQEHIAYSEAVRIVVEDNYDVVGRRVVARQAGSSASSRS